MKLSEYAALEGIKYRAAWNRFKQGKIPGAYINDAGRIVVPDPRIELQQRAAIYARVSTPGQKDDLERQVERLKQFAAASEYGKRGARNRAERAAQALGGPDA